MVDPVTGGLIGWACGKLGDTVLKHLPGDRQLSKQLDKTVAQWAKSLPKDQFVDPDALFPYVDPSTAKTERPEYCALQAKLVKGGLPEKQMWHGVFVESWHCVRVDSEEPQPFFQLDESEASKDLEELAEATYEVCVRHEPIFKQAVIGTLGAIDGKIDDIHTYLREVLELRESAPGEKIKALWPEISLPLGGPKVSEPFGERQEELDSLTTAMSADKTVVAVVGMAGQGKSCLAGEWYKRGARPPEKIGLIWRKVYEAGYTFDRFVDELHLYLTGERIDRQALTTIEARTQIVEAILRDKPCWIVLDGVERWLNRWVAEPDAGIDGLTADDRAGQHPVLDKFLKGASFWDNGSRLLLTTRAVPSALDENPPVRIGRRARRKTKPDEFLTDLKPADAVKLITDLLGVKGNTKIKRQAARAYGFHPYAVHVLGDLIRDLYDRDISRWEQVNPLREPKLEGLFERIIEHRSEDLELLELIACSVGPAPVQMLTEKLGQDEIEIRRKLAELAKWQMVEFEKDEAGQHTVVRKYLIERMGAENARETQKSIAGWWAEQEVPARPDRIEQMRPLLRAVEQLLAASDPEAATDIFLSKQSHESCYTVGEWLWRFGYLDEHIRINGEAIKAYLGIIRKEASLTLWGNLANCYNNQGLAQWNQGRLAEAVNNHNRAIEIFRELFDKKGWLELSSKLAASYNNRGLVLNEQGKIAESITDYDRAIEIREQLVKKEGRRELRNNLAMCYNNRGGAYENQGRLSEATDDYRRAIEVYMQLIEKEERRELSSELAMCYNNRGGTLRLQGKLSEAIVDFGNAIEYCEKLVAKKGRRELRNVLAKCYYNRGGAFKDQGKLSESAADINRSIKLYEQLVEREGRRDLRDELAGSYVGRGSVYLDQGRFCEAIADYGLSIRILEELVAKERRRELRIELARSYYGRGNPFRIQGRFSEALADFSLAIEITEQLVTREGRIELRSDLVACYNNRGSVLSDMNKHSEAISDFSLAIEITEQLFAQEGRLDLGNLLATCYNNRGSGLANKGKLSEAILDFGRSIEIDTDLVAKEGRRELRGDLCRALFNRAFARTQTEEWEGASADIDKGGGLLRELIEEGQRHVIGSFMETAGLRCANAKQLGDVAKAAQWANDAMRWFVEEGRAGRGNEMLLKAAMGFEEDVKGNVKVLLKNGLDEGLWEKFRAALKEARGQP